MLLNSKSAIREQVAGEVIATYGRDFRGREEALSGQSEGLRMAL